MRNKRFLSTVVAAALVVTTMAMPVMAANEQSGSVDVDVSTKTGVLRVAVPTQMAMVIDQFEINQAGAQIASGEFDMVNHSEMAVKVDITSTATLGTGVTLVATKAAATDSTTEGEAWLAVAAQTADDVYDDEATDATTENYYDLTDANANVATFDATNKQAKQTFYLEKAAAQDSSSNPATEVYTYAIADAQGKISGAYAQYYALTPISTINNADTLQTAVDAGDVYVVVGDTDTDGSTHIPAVDGAVMTKIVKGTDCDAVSPAITYDAKNEYYTAATTTAAPTANGKYMYVAMSTDGGKAGFQYVGKLSNANEKTWTESDISKISIGYNIKGVTSSSYDAVKNDCTYGLYKEKPKDVAPSLVSPASVQAAAGTPVEIKLDLGAGSKKATAAVSMIWKEKNANIGTDPNVTYENGVITIGAASIDGLLADESNFPVTLEITFDDAANTKVEVTLTK